MDDVFGDFYLDEETVRLRVAFRFLGLGQDVLPVGRDLPDLLVHPLLLLLGQVFLQKKKAN